MKIGIQTWGSEGDIRPFIALAIGLQQEGHQVTLALIEPENRDYQKYADNFGFKLIKIPIDDYSLEDLEQVIQDCISEKNPITQAKIIINEGYFPLVDRMYKVSEELCQNNELVIRHFFLHTLQAAAEKFGVQEVSVNIAHNSIPSKNILLSGFPNLGKWINPISWKIGRKVINKALLEEFNKLRKRENLPPKKDLMTEIWASETLNLIAVSREICKKQDDWEKLYEVCGFLNTPTEDLNFEFPQSLEKFLESDEPTVYFSFGSMMPTSAVKIRETVEIFREATNLVGCKAIIQIAETELRNYQNGENFYFLSYFPYSLIFPKCNLVVHHGGAGTTQSSLLAGTPSLIVAHLADQFFWGEELHRLGVSPKHLLRRTLKAEDLAARIKTVLASPEMKENAKSIGQKMKNENGVQNAIKILQKKFGIKK
ncbi:MAG: glycosyltransferase [Calditrichaeota bacterium]|nr:MAG: glycosyltransferase [Calditrichota bacterium]